MSDESISLAVLISGSGRTLKNLIDLAAIGELPVDIRLVISSNPAAGRLEFAEVADIPTVVLQRQAYPDGLVGHKAYSADIFNACREAEVDYVAMAGFVKYVPVPDDFENRVLNIHPALIPAFCGRGMYGPHLHEAVIEHGAKVSGCTVHFVDNQYDNGPIIWQQPTPVFDDDTADTLADRVFELEKEAYPHVLRLLAGGRIELVGRKVKIGSPRQL